MARQLNLFAVSNFHRRFGDQGLVGEDVSGSDPARVIWGRTYGADLKQDFQGTLAPSFNGTLWGGQVGVDLAAATMPENTDERFGLFTSYGTISSTVRGFVAARVQNFAGRLPMSAWSAAGYWTHLDPDGWYVDTVLMGSWFTSHPLSFQQIGAKIDGRSFAASTEFGYPFRFDGGFTLEPMAQLVFQTLSFDNARDPFSTLAFSPGDSFFGRIGARLEYDTQIGDTHVRPFFETNILRDFGGHDTTIYNSVVPLSVPFGNTDAQIVAGVDADISQSASLYASASYLGNLGGAYQRVIQGNLGFRFRW